MKYPLVIFDMDGTLTEELLDFDAIRSDIGLPSQGPILELISHMDEAGQQRAHAILDRHELTAAADCVLHEGAVEVLDELRRRGHKTALLTRNSARCAQIVLERHALTLDHVATRDDLPYKPHADSILNIVRRFQADIRGTLMVGDYLYDLQAANAAGCDSVLLCKRDSGTRPPFANLATYTADELRDVLTLVA